MVHSQSDQSPYLADWWQDWQSFLLISLGWRGHVINKRFTIDIWIVYEEHWAGLHLDLSFHVDGTLYLCYSYTARGYASALPVEFS